MGPTDEHLYAELQVTGSSAWAQLFSDVTSQLEANVPGRGLLPMPAVRGLAFDPDRIVRRASGPYGRVRATGRDDGRPRSDLTVRPDGPI